MSDGMLNPAAERALMSMERSLPFHDAKNRRILEQQEAYEGILKWSSEAAQWESHLHPPLINHAIETAMTMLLDDDLGAKVTPVAMPHTPQGWQAAQDGARAHERLFHKQMLDDRFNEFQRPFVLQAAINRVSIAKTGWRYEKETRTVLEAKKLVPMLPAAMSPTRLREKQVERVTFNGPVTETVDLRDFYWHDAATSLDNARWCAHAVWMTYADIKAKADAGLYDPAAVALLDPDVTDDAHTPQGNEIELERERRSRRNGLIEVLELWDRDTKTLHILGARKALLKQGGWPYWHQQFPFVSMSLAPFPFSIQGLSLVEKLADMQTAYWSLLNQTLDNTKLINNAIVLLAADYDDPDSFEYAPGAVNVVDNPQQVEMWAPNVNIAQVAMPMIEKLQGDMQNLAMGQPIALPTSGRVTATEIATLSQIAQNAAKKMKDQVVYAYNRIGYQRMCLNQQYIRETTYFHGMGLDQQPVVETISPEAYMGDYQFEFDIQDESTVRAERRAEAQALVNVSVQAAPVFAASGVPLNLKQPYTKLLEAYGVPPEEWDAWFSAQAPMGSPAGAGAPGQQPPPGAPEGAGPGGQPVGVTGQGSIAPNVSPSSQASLAPGVMMARAMSSQGGAAAGGGTGT